MSKSPCWIIQPLQPSEGLVIDNEGKRVSLQVAAHTADAPDDREAFEFGRAVVSFGLI